MLLPMCVNAANSLEETNFIDLHGANKGLTNGVVTSIYDKRDVFYNEVNFDSLLKSKELKLLGANYIATLSNEVSDNIDFISELGLGYRMLHSKYDGKTTNFNIADVALKMYLSYNINEDELIRNAINIGALGHDAIMFKDKDKFNLNEIDTALFAQYYLRVKYGIFKMENSATVAYNYNLMRDIKNATNALLLNKHNENYFDALLKTKTGLEFETDVLDFRTFLVVSYNARLNKRNNLTMVLKNQSNLNSEYKDGLNVGLESEVSAGVFGIKFNTGYDVLGKSFYYGLNANLRF